MTTVSVSVDVDVDVDEVLDEMTVREIRDYLAERIGAGAETSAADAVRDPSRALDLVDEIVAAAGCGDFVHMHVLHVRLRALLGGDPLRGPRTPAMRYTAARAQ